MCVASGVPWAKCVSGDLSPAYAHVQSQQLWTLKLDLCRLYLLVLQMASSQTTSGVKCRHVRAQDQREGSPVRTPKERDRNTEDRNATTGGSLYKVSVTLVASCASQESSLSTEPGIISKHRARSLAQCQDQAWGLSTQPRVISEHRAHK